MSQSPTDGQPDPQASYLDAWDQLARRIQRGSSFSGRERNCCFLNTRTDRFADVSSAVGLDQIDDSRAVGIVDWDHDGDLDLWVANRTGPRVRFLRNDMPQSGESIGIRLIGSPDLGTARDAIGARVVLTVIDQDGTKSSRMQSLYAGDGFLSQSSKWLHFAVTKDETPESLTVRWPGTSQPERFVGVQLGRRHLLRQATGKAEIVERSRQVALTPSTPQPPPLANRARVRLSEPPLLTEILYQTWEGDPVQLEAPWDGPMLVILWASWCQPCLAELSELNTACSELGDQAPKLLALNVEHLDGSQPDVDQLQTTLRDVGFVGEAGLASSQLVSRLNEFHEQAVYRRRSLPLPSSVLLDHGGWLRVIYKGQIQIEKLVTDVRNLRTTKEQARDLAVLFAGRWGDDVFVTNPIAVTNVQIEQGYLDEARDYLQKFLDENNSPPAGHTDEAAVQQRLRLADVHHQSSIIEGKSGNKQAALDHLRRALAFHPGHVRALIDVSAVLRSAGKLDEAHGFLVRAAQARPNSADLHNKLGIIRMQQGSLEEAIRHFREALQVDANWHPAANNLAWILATTRDSELRDAEMAVRLAEQVCRASSFAQPQALDTYAAALAANGQYEKAVEIVARALEIAKESVTTESLQRLIEKLEARKALYESRQPFRE